MGSLTICKPVHNVKFSPHGQEAIKIIKRDLNNARIGGTLLMAGIFNNIFTETSSVGQIAVNVGMSDWEGLAKVAGDWPATIRAIIARKAHEMVIYTNGQEQVFWEELSRCLSE